MLADRECRKRRREIYARGRHTYRSGSGRCVDLGVFLLLDCEVRRRPIRLSPREGDGLAVAIATRDAESRVAESSAYEAAESVCTPTLDARSVQLGRIACMHPASAAIEERDAGAGHPCSLDDPGWTGLWRGTQPRYLRAVGGDPHSRQDLRDIDPLEDERGRSGRRAVDENRGDPRGVSCATERERENDAEAEWERCEPTQELHPVLRTPP